MHYLITPSAHQLLRTMPPEALVIYDGMLSEIDFITEYPEQFADKIINGYVKVPVEKLAELAWTTERRVIFWLEKFDDMKLVEIDGDYFAKEMK